MTGVCLVLIILSIVLFVIVRVRRMKIQIHFNLKLHKGACKMDGCLKWHRFTFFKKAGQLDLSHMDDSIKVVQKSKADNASENPETEFSWRTMKKVGHEILKEIEQCDQVKFRAKVRMGCYEPEHTAYATAVLFIIKSTVISYIKHRQPMIDVSLQIDPEFQHPEFSLQIHSMIQLVPGQAIRIIRGLNQARKDGLK